jgi:hypothetical protein
MTITADGSTLTGPTSTGSLTDELGVVWTLAGGIIYRNGVKTVSGSVILLLYYGGTIYQQNINKNWWQWVDTTWVALANDPRPVVITPPVPSTITITPGVTYTGSLAIGTVTYSIGLTIGSPTGTAAKPITTDG